ncbi:MAG: YSC84-related protein [Deltaproteobacteria bacterium]|nr:YSC84-related protein [Deltaproteobacteria bacterium]
MSKFLPTAIAACALLLAADRASAKEGPELTTDVRRTMSELYAHSPSARDLAAKANGILVFPSIYKAGLGVGGSYGEGALLQGDKLVGYYNIVAGSVGWQIGAQKQSVVLMFLTPESYRRFLDSQGWKAGVDGSVAIFDVGAGKSLDSKTLQQPIVGFIFSEKGLMAGLTLEGSKITKIVK